MKPGTISTPRVSTVKVSPRGPKHEQTMTSRSNRSEKRGPKRQQTATTEYYMKNLDKLTTKENGDLNEVLTSSH
jgi:hypothetical protein